MADHQPQVLRPERVGGRSGPQLVHACSPPPHVEHRLASHGQVGHVAAGGFKGSKLDNGLGVAGRKQNRLGGGILVALGTIFVLMIIVSYAD